MSWSSRTYYGDASGGEHTSYNEIRRCGCAVVAVHPDGSLHFGASFSLPGIVQTVARAELFALVFLISQADPLTEVTFVTDNKGVNDMFNQGPKACKRSTNCDLYKQLFQTVYDKAIRLQVRWMPSHLECTESGVRPLGVSLLDVQGNEHADTLASDAAKKACVPLHVSAEYLYWVNLTKSIQHRLATILINLPDRNKAKIEKPERGPRPDLTALFASSSHSVYQDKERVGCARCHNNFHIKDASLEHWLQCSCPHGTSDRDRPVPIPYMEVHVGNNITHTSHTMLRYRGLVYCKKCGNRGTYSQLRKLSKPCTPPTDYGRKSLSALAQGKLPPGLTQWPSAVNKTATIATISNSSQGELPNHPSSSSDSCVRLIPLPTCRHNLDNSQDSRATPDDSQGYV